MAVHDITDAEFSEKVLKSSKPVLVDYWADWCSPCKQLSPIIEELSNTYGDRMEFMKMDTNANPTTPVQQMVQGLPTIQIFVDGQVVKQFMGAKTKRVLTDAIEEHI
ncbi:thioredoxin [Mariniluteicoccus endophyticus]